MEKPSYPLVPLDIVRHCGVQGKDFLNWLIAETRPLFRTIHLPALHEDAAAVGGEAAFEVAAGARIATVFGFVGRTTQFGALSGHPAFQAFVAAVVGVGGKIAAPALLFVVVGVTTGAHLFKALVT